MNEKNKKHLILNFLKSFKHLKNSLDMNAAANYYYCGRNSDKCHKESSKVADVTASSQ